MNKIITPEYTEYQLIKGCKITVYKDLTMSITLAEDTIDLQPDDVRALYRIVSEYMATLPYKLKVDYGQYNGTSKQFKDMILEGLKGGKE